MVRKIGRNLQLYFSFAFLLIILGLAAGGYLFWQSGISTGHHVTAIYQASTLLEELQKNRNLSKVESLLKEGKIRTLSRGLDHLDQQVRDVNRIKDFERYYNLLRRDMGPVRVSLDKLLTTPKVSKIFQVFEGKLSRFNKFSADNSWRTLTRISTQTLARLNGLKNYSLKKISPLRKSISDDLDRMERAARSSRLSSLDKRLITGRLKILRLEVTMLAKYVENLRLFWSNYKKFNISYKNWIKHVMPEVSLEKAMITQKGKQFGIFMLAIFSLAVALFLGNIWIYRRHRSQVKKISEEYVLDTIQNKLLVTGPAFDDESIEFQKEFKKGHRYIHKRMSFGSIFQEAFPFGAILLDSNLKVLWANQIFCDSWEVSKGKIEQESINWDSICRLTNLGENDPIRDALNGSLAGIYQIQGPGATSSDSTPFEMYVNPVEYAGQKRILIFFYPLSALEQIMEDHSTSIMTPMEKSLEALIAGNFLSEGKNEFSMVGMDHIYERLQFLNTSLNTERHNHGEEMERLRAELRYYQKTLGEIQRWRGLVENIQEKYRQYLINLKGNIINLSENAGTQHINAKNIIDNVKDVLKGRQKVANYSHFFYDDLQRLQKAIGGLTRLRGVFHKRPHSIEDKGLLKTIKSLDIILSKVEMMIEMDKVNERMEELQQAELNFRESQKEFNALVLNGQNISVKMGEYEEKVVRDIKQMYQATVQMGRSLRYLEETLIDDEAEGCLIGPPKEALLSSKATS